MTENLDNVSDLAQLAAAGIGCPRSVQLGGPKVVRDWIEGEFSRIEVARQAEESEAATAAQEEGGGEVEASPAGAGSAPPPADPAKESADLDADAEARAEDDGFAARLQAGESWDGPPEADPTPPDALTERLDGLSEAVDGVLTILGALTARMEAVESAPKPKPKRRRAASK